MQPDRTKIRLFCAAGAALLAVLAVASLLTGKYPLTLEGMLAGDEMQLRVFWTLRASRTAVGVVGGFALGGVDEEVGAAGGDQQNMFHSGSASLLCLLMPLLFGGFFFSFIIGNFLFGDKPIFPGCLHFVEYVIIKKTARGVSRPLLIFPSWFCFSQRRPSS